MSDIPQDPSQPPRDAPGAWPPPSPQPGWTPPAQAGWTPASQPGYPPQPGYPAPGYPMPGYSGAFPPNLGIAPPTLATGFEYGGFWIRQAARGLDAYAILGLTLLCAITIVGILAIPFLWLGYFPFFWSRGQTPGQRICGLRLVRESDGMPIDGGTAIVRFVVVIGELLACVFLIGYLALIWPAFEARKRAWHDMAAGNS
ncbi:MAG TPA: RDD family protein [Terriglobales bacterium]|nr:RDD family protein [Terriglobales bacterium]